MIAWSIAAWCLFLVYRSWGGFFSGVFYLMTIAWVYVSLFVSAVKKYKNHASIASYLPEITGLVIFSLLQEKYFISMYGRTASVIGAAIGLTYLFIYGLKTKKLLTNFISALTFFALLGAILAPRQFHSLFRSSTFESYVTKRFPDRSPEATRLIQENAPDTSKTGAAAIQLLREGLLADSARNIPLALELLNKSIELNPFSDSAYYCRGMIRLLHAELSKESAMEAEKDLSSSIRLNPKRAAAYYYRVHAGSFIGRKNLICDDIQRCESLDTQYVALLQELKEKNCLTDSSGNFSAE